MNLKTKEQMIAFHKGKFPCGATVALWTNNKLEGKEIEQARVVRHTPTCIAVKKVNRLGEVYGNEHLYRAENLELLGSSWNKDYKYLLKEWSEALVLRADISRGREELQKLKQELYETGAMSYKEMMSLSKKIISTAKSVQEKEQELLALKKSFNY